ncbi:MAG TPA: AsmA-like C-terminal region-containing protein [Planctomycetota bacterium]|nr:AsmA-like C-terminal region-containing protein [Planctomycetota bacterium]
MRALRAGVLVGFLAVALAPTLLSTRPGRDFALALSRPFLPFEVEMGDLAAGWTKGIDVRDLRVRGQDGVELLAARRVQASVAVLSLLRGEVDAVARIEDPRATVRRRKDGTVEVAGFRFPTPASGGGIEEPRGTRSGRRHPFEPGRSRRLRSADLSVSGGALRLVDEAAGTEASLEEITLSLRARAPDAPVEFEGSARLRAHGQTGTASFRGSARPTANAGEVDLRFDAFDLAPLSPLAAAGGAVARIAGVVEGTLSISVGEDGTIASGGELRARDLRLEGGRPGAGSWVEPSITIRPSLRFDPRARTLSADGFEVRTSFASLVGRGRGGGSGEQASADGALDFACDLGAALDRARPFSPGLPAGTGRIAGKATASGSGGSLRVDLEAQATGLALSGPGVPRDLLLPESMALRGVLVYEAKTGQVLLQGARLEAGPLSANLAASREVGMEGPVLTGRAKAGCELAAIEPYLRPFLPGGLLLAGTFASEVSFHGDSTAFLLEGEASISDLYALRPGRSELRRERLEAGLELLQESGGDRLQIRRARLVTGPSEFETTGEIAWGAGGPLALHMRGGGDLADLADLAKPFLESPSGARGSLRVELDVEGTRRAGRFALRSGVTGATAGESGARPLDATVECDGTIAAGSLDLTVERGRIVAPFGEADFGGAVSTRDGRTTVDARFTATADLARAEPYFPRPLTDGAPLSGSVRLEGSAKGSPESASFVARLSSSGLAGGSLEGRLTGTYGRRDGLPSIEAKGDLRADLASLLPLARLADPRLDLAGTLRGDLRTTRSGAETRLEATLSGEDLRIGTRPRPAGGAPEQASPILEKEARVELALALDAGADRLRLERADVHAASAGLEAKVRGTVEAASKSAFLDASAELSADAEALRSSLGALLPADLRFSGRAAGRFTLGGTLRPDPLRGIAVSGTIEAPSLALGDQTFLEGRIEVALSGGALRVRELRGRLNDGELSASGTVEFSGGGPPLLALEGRAKDVKVRRGLVLPLAHLVPIFASARPGQAEVSGAVTGDFALRGRGLDASSLRDHLSGNARVSLGAGSVSGSPDVLPLLAALNRRGSFRFDDVAAAFELSGGRLATDGIRIGSEEASLTLVGSTGLDGTLDYRILVDLPERVDRRSWGAALEKLFGAGGLPVGLTGTVRSPSLTLRAPEAKDAAGGLLQGGLERLLEGLKKKDEEDRKKKKRRG